MKCAIRPVWLAPIVLLLSAACGSDEAATAGCADNDKLDRSAQFAMETAGGDLPAGTIGIDAAALGSGSTQDIELRIVNRASLTTGKPLTIRSVTLTETDPDGNAVEIPAFSCTGADGQPCASSKWPEVIPAGWDSDCAASGAASSASVRIRYTRPANSPARRAQLTVEVSGDIEAEKAPQIVSFAANEGVSHLVCKPANVDFGSVPLDTPRSETLSCANTGTGPVRIQALQVFGPLPLAVTWDALTVTSTQPYSGQPPLVLEAGTSAKLTLLLDGLSDITPRKGIFRVESDDLSSPRIDIDVLVNTEGPCLKAVGGDVDFGAVQVGVTSTKEVVLQSCGTEAVSLEEVNLAAGSDAGFGLQFTSSCFGGTAPSATAPKVLQPGANCTVFVTFTPTQLGSTATGVLRAKASASTVEIGLSGKANGVQQCPVACFAVKDASGAEVSAVVPQTKLLFDASCSQPGGGATVVTQYTWKVTQPKESYAALLPSAKTKTPTLTPNVAGSYEIALEIKDDLGQSSCAPVKQTIQVVPDDKLHLELVWVTPGDVDATDEGDASGKLPNGTFAGADMDLHLAHPAAAELSGQADADKNGEPDPWFAPCFDCSVFNPLPSWGDFGDPEDDATLERDDKDGWGPENISIPLPETDVAYAIGVHYWGANGFGASTPVVRVYFEGSSTPSFVLQGPEMLQGEFWCTGTVSWPKNEWKPCKGANAAGVLVTKSYPFSLGNGLTCQ